MSSFLLPQQLDLLHASCAAGFFDSTRRLDSSTFHALATTGLNLGKTAPLLYNAGQIICREGEPGDVMYLIRSGSAVIMKGSFDAPVVLACRGAGEFVGEMALLENLPRSASVVALEEVSVYPVTRADFQRLLSHSTKLDLGMLRQLSAYLREADDLIANTAQARRTLSSQLSELAAENQQLLELQRLREETTDLVIHDLRNPLHGIMGAVGMLQMVLPEELLQQNHDLFNLVNHSCERMQRLVDSLLDISRMESGETQLALEPVNPAPLLQLAMSRVATTLQGRGIASSVFMPARLPVVLLDEQMIERVIINLLDNAIKFTPSGGQISLMAQAQAGYLAVSVNDTGTGIPPEQRAYVFERFARGRHDAQQRGFGLGLTFCRLAVEAHGGKIWVEDGDGGVGCKCIFTLPFMDVGQG